MMARVMAVDRGDETSAGSPGSGAGMLPHVLRHAVAATVAPQGMTIATNAADYPLVYANEAFLRMTGFSPNEILGRNCRFLQCPDTDPVQLAVIKRALTAGESVTAVLRNHRRDGSAFWNRIAISPVRDPESNAITHFIGTQTEVQTETGRPTGT
jgi:PAS domain S-box-containing protein